MARARDLTTSTCENPVVLARTCRSTPGYTSGYTAVSPDSTGAGSAAGQVIDSEPGPSPSRASAPDPPPDNRRSTDVAFGATVPSDWRTNVGSTATQPEPRRTRTGTALCSSVSAPDGSANVCAVSLTASETSTRLPHARASAVEAPAEPADNSGTAHVLGAVTAASAFRGVNTCAGTSAIKTAAPAGNHRRARRRPAFPHARSTTAFSPVCCPLGRQSDAGTPRKHATAELLANSWQNVSTPVRGPAGGRDGRAGRRTDRRSSKA